MKSLKNETAIGGRFEFFLESFQSRIKDDDTNRINETIGPAMNSTFQNDELRNTLKETVSEILNDTGVLNGVRKNV